MIISLNPEHASYIYEHQQMYPRPMREELETFQRLLLSGFCWGYINPLAPTPAPTITGWILFELDQNFVTFPDNHTTYYCYDLAVLPEHQGKNIATRLWIHACKELRWLNYWIRAHCRKQSYSIITRFVANYDLVIDRFIENHYEKEYDSAELHGEHAHEIILKPTGQL